jgi:hypothetical protein
MRPPTNNWRLRRTEHRFYEEIITDITTRNVKTHKRKTQTIKKMSNTDPTKKTGDELLLFVFVRLRL